MLIISGSMAKKYGKMPKHLWDHQIAGSSPNHHVEGWEGGLHQRARDTHQGFPDPPPMLSTRQGLRCGRPTSSSSSPTVHSRGTAGGTGAEARLTAPPPSPGGCLSHVPPSPSRPWAGATGDMARNTVGFDVNSPSSEQRFG